jgi:2-dehydro-3-deoxygalactonokinase
MLRPLRVLNAVKLKRFKMDKFLSCDWGTSFFRLRLVRYENLEVIAEEKNDEGIAKTFTSWKNQGAEAGKRQAFYQSVITKSIQILSQRLDYSLAGIPVIISGMAASNIGMIELPYKEIPVATDGSDFEIKELVIEEVENPFIIISGIKTTNDVIRGEETKIVGCSSHFTDDDEKFLIFTGTHPKHVTIESKKVIAIKTYMTGEFFNLLINHSVLASSVKIDANFDDPSNQRNFKEGVKDSLKSNLLQSAFGVRTNDILKNIPRENNFNYLSGLLIGTELRDVLNCKYPIYLCGGGDLICYYKSAFDILGINVFMEIDADTALLNGQKRIYSHYLGGNL